MIGSQLISDLLTPVAPPSFVSSLPYPAVAAHRGGLATRPENTLTAFRAAPKDAVLEMDVRQLADGALVLWHDTTVDRSAANATGRVDTMTTTEWETLRVHNPSGDPAPASFLADVLDEYEFSDRVLMIELKDARARDKFIRTVWPHRGRVIACSFNEAAVRIFAGSGLPAQQLSGTALVRPGLHSVGIRADSITADFCHQAHMQDVKVWAWSADGHEETLLAMGVDGLILNNI